MKKVCVALLLCVMAGTTWGQEWQEYQLTDFPSPDAYVREYDAVFGPNGVLHLFYIADLDVQIGGLMRVYYTRVSPYGEVLTDTLQLNEELGYWRSPYNVNAVLDDNGNAWCVWSDGLGVDPHSFYLTGRDSLGQEIFAPMALGSAGNLGVHDVDAAFCPLDQTIIVGFAGGPVYHQITLTGDTLAYSEPFGDENRPSVYMTTKTAPNGRVWAGTRHSIGQPADIVLYEFVPDSDVIAHYPFGHSQDERWGLYDFAIDHEGNFHCLVYHDTAALVFVKLDNMFLLQEWRTLVSNPSVEGTLGVDEQGNCLMSWYKFASDSLMWAMRGALGEWQAEPTLLDTSGAIYMHITSVGEDRWIMTIGQLGEIHMFTYGFPLDYTDERPATAVQLVTQAFPNPFNSTLTLRLGAASGGSIRLFDILGREILVRDIERGTTTVTLTHPTLQQLPSGTYWLTFEGRDIRQTLPIIHTR